MARKFYGWFNASDLIKIDNEHGDELAVLVLSPSAFALLGRLSELVYWEDLIVDDTDGSGFDQMLSRIYMEMGYSHDLSGQLADMNRVLGDMHTAMTSRLAADNQRNTVVNNMNSSIGNLTDAISDPFRSGSVVVTMRETVDDLIAALPQGGGGGLTTEQYDALMTELDRLNDAMGGQ